MTDFEQAQQSVKEGKLQTPTVGTIHGEVDYFKYQLAVHKMQLKLYTKGIIPHRGWKITPMKKYYGLKGNTNKCLEQLIEITNKYITSLAK